MNNYCTQKNIHTHAHATHWTPRKQQLQHLQPVSTKSKFDCGEVNFHGEAPGSDHTHTHKLLPALQQQQMQHEKAISVRTAGGT